MIINYFIISEVYYGGTYSELIKDNSICIFKGFNGKLFAFGLRKLIERYYNTDAVLDYLRYAIRLLHFIKSTVNNSEKS
jgi:hypothetical protein